jgi:ElaB/YqjD/DUF883 family membrane-anchored ribosome-binding protein
MAKQSIDSIGKKIVELGESGKSLISDPELQRKIHTVKTNAERVIRKHPIVSIGVGLLAGYLIGSLFRRD